MSDRRPDRWVVLGAVVAVFGLYLPFLAAPFEYDDKVEILLNQVIRAPGNVPEMVAYNPFRVLLMYTFAADVWAWGLLRPEPYRFENILIHAANTTLLASVLRALSPSLLEHTFDRGRDLFVAAGTLTFAVHPLAIESVTYVSGRSSSLACFWVLLSLWAYLTALRITRNHAVESWVAARRKRTNLLLGGGLLAASLVSIPVAWLHERGTIAGERALLVAIGGTAVLLVLGGAVLGGRRQTQPQASPETATLGRRAGRFYVGAFVAFVLGCLTKEIAAVLPGLLLLVEAIVVGRSWRSALRALRGPLFPFFAIPAYLIALRVAAYGYIGSPVTIRPWSVNLITQFEVVVRYVGMWWWPATQSIHHDPTPLLLPGTAWTWACGVLLLGGAAVATASIRRAPALAFAVLAILGTLAPTSSFIPLKETMVEHRTYVPSIGFAVLTGWAAAELLERVRGRTPVVVVLLMTWLVGLGTLHVRYDRLWMSEETLWRHAVEVNPDSSDAWRYLGDLYVETRRLEDARRAFERSTEARPNHTEVVNKLGHVLALMGDVPAAEQQFRAAIAQDGCFAPALNNLATVRKIQGAANDAVDLYTRALQCDPINWLAHRGLGDIYLAQLQDKEKAAHHYSAALERMDPLHPAASVIKNRLMELSW